MSSAEISAAGEGIESLYSESDDDIEWCRFAGLDHDLPLPIPGTQIPQEVDFSGNDVLLVQTSPSIANKDGAQQNPTNSILSASVDDGKLSKEEVSELDNVRATIQLSPFDRFRRARNCLSVTDIVSPLWCQSQFQYTLEKGGRKRRTSAMKKGHEIHEALESELHTTVAFTVEKDERRALQMLRMLCCLVELETGDVTRELPVFGYIGNILVTGVIDELSMTTIDPESAVQVTRIDNFFTPKAQLPGNKAIVLSDTKTRVSNTEPSTSQMDQAKLQLMLYWQLLKDLPEVSIQQIFKDEDLESDKPLSDAFLAQAIELLDSYSAGLGDQMIAHNSLTGLWSLLRQKLIDMRQLLSTELRVRYIHQKSKSVISVRSYQVDLQWSSALSSRVLAWWTGQQEAKGIEIEEAFKCRLCIFEEGCSWRLGKVQEGIEAKRAARITKQRKT